MILLVALCLLVVELCIICKQRFEDTLPVVAAAAVASRAAINPAGTAFGSVMVAVAARTGAGSVDCPVKALPTVMVPETFSVVQSRVFQVMARSSR